MAQPTPQKNFIKKVLSPCRFYVKAPSLRLYKILYLLESVANYFRNP